MHPSLHPAANRHITISWKSDLKTEPRTKIELQISKAGAKAIKCRLQKNDIDRRSTQLLQQKKKLKKKILQEIPKKKKKILLDPNYAIFICASIDFIISHKKRSEKKM